MTTPITNRGLREFVDHVWSDSHIQLAVRMRVSRQGLRNLLNGEHKNEPVILLERLRDVLAPRLHALGVDVSVEDVRRMWRNMSTAD